MEVNSKGDVKIKVNAIVPRDYSSEEDDGDVDLPFKGMRKMTTEQQKKFPMIAVDSLLCQSYYISVCKKCSGCSFAINGCEKIVEMSAG